MMKTSRMLSKRERTLLKHIVESYIRNALPVGSRYLAKAYNLGISPATIRNVMNDLEEMGYLKQPHVSAGRIPTDKGYRFYVDCLTSTNAFGEHDRQLILANFSDLSIDVEEILEVSSRVLGEISSQLGVVLEPSFYNGIFNKMELVSISDTRILAVITIESGLVKTIMMEIQTEVSRDQLHETSRIINERLSGLSLKEVKDTLDKRLADTGISNPMLLRTIIRFADKLFSFQKQKDLHVGGTMNIMSNPEFSDHVHVSKIIELIDRKENILHFLNATQTDNLTVRIGRENEGELFSEYSVISARYRLGRVAGTLGVVGPTRMHYSRIIPLVSFMGDVLTRKLCSVWC